jgi:dephospho-CoA kinase
MKQSKIVGITGGIGTGKSLVSSYLLKKGYTVVDFDSISRKIYVKGKDSYGEVVSLFGSSILDENNEVDRSKLAAIVFEDNSKLKVLNEITHKYIFKEALDCIIKHLGEKTIFLDIPLLYEVREEIEQYGIQIDEVWFVYSDRELQIKRVMERDSIDYSAAVKRVDAQIPTDEKIKYADKVICNLGDKEDVYRQIDMLLES